MAWERRRNGRLFYYRVRRTAAGRVVKEYLGRGPAAEQVAQQVEQARAERAARTARRSCVKEALADLDGLTAGCNTLTAAVFLTQGFCDHHGEWRRPGGYYDDENQSREQVC
jgi:hypothetical protein